MATSAEPASRPAATALAGECGVRASVLVGDVTNGEAMEKAARRIAREHGRIDHVVYAVAVGSGKMRRRPQHA